MVTSYAFGTADALDRSARHSWEEIMDSRLYLTVALDRSVDAFH
jgi:hypothetical protein